jgi:hypothetical protein
MTSLRFHRSPCPENEHRAYPSASTRASNGQVRLEKRSINGGRSTCTLTTSVASPETSSLAALRKGIEVVASLESPPQR